MLRKFNKQLREDYFAGRFELKQIGRIDYSQPNFLVYKPNSFTIDEVGDPNWLINIYRIELIDNEEPERNCIYRCRYSKDFGLVDVQAETIDGRRYVSNAGLPNIQEVLNNFIIESDFSEKSKSLEYARTHWYSGAELEKMVQMLGPEWISADELAKFQPERFSK